MARGNGLVLKLDSLRISCQLMETKGSFRISMAGPQNDSLEGSDRWLAHLQRRRYVTAPLFGLRPHRLRRTIRPAPAVPFRSRILVVLAPPRLPTRKPHQKKSQVSQPSEGNSLVARVADKLSYRWTFHRAEAWHSFAPKFPRHTPRQIEIIHRET